MDADGEVNVMIRWNSRYLSACNFTEHCGRTTPTERSYSASLGLIRAHGCDVRGRGCCCAIEHGLRRDTPRRSESSIVL